MEHYSFAVTHKAAPVAERGAFDVGQAAGDGVYTAHCGDHHGGKATSTYITYTPLEPKVTFAPCVCTVTMASTTTATPTDVN